MGPRPFFLRYLVAVALTTPVASAVAGQEAPQRGDVASQVADVLARTQGWSDVPERADELARLGAAVLPELLEILARREVPDPSPEATAPWIPPITKIRPTPAAIGSLTKVANRNRAGRKITSCSTVLA